MLEEYQSYLTASKKFQQNAYWLCICREMWDEEENWWAVSVLAQL